MTFEIDEGMQSPHKKQLISSSLTPLSDQLVGCAKEPGLYDTPAEELGLTLPGDSTFDSVNHRLSDEDRSSQEDDFDDSRIGIEAYRQTHARYDGYFDEDANFVQFSVDGDAPRDNWRENLKSSGTRLEGQDEKGASSIQNDNGVSEVEELDLVQIKIKLASLLEPGESALDALARTSTSLPEFDGERLMQSSILLESERTVPEETKPSFEELMHCCSLLMSNGECSIYSQIKEEILEHLNDQEDASEEDSDCDSPYAFQTMPDKAWTATLFGPDSSCGQDLSNLGTEKVSACAAL